MAKVFLIAPFEKPFDSYFNTLRLALSERGHQLFRADDIFIPGIIINDIFRSINSADVIIADTTRLNANVFYELGIAHSHQKPVIIITQSIEELPFDIRHLRCIKYDPIDRRWSQKLVANIVNFIDEIIGKDDWLPVISDFTFGGVYLKSFAEIISTAEQIVSNAKNYFFVTRLTPNEAILPHEKKYFELTRERIKGSNVKNTVPNYRRLVRVSSPDSMQLALDLLEEYQCCPNFQMAVVASNRLQLNFEVFIADNLSMIAFGAEQMGGALESAMLVKNHRIAQKWSSFYLNLWGHPVTTIVKPSGVLTDEKLKIAKEEIFKIYSTS